MANKSGSMSVAGDRAYHIQVPDGHFFHRWERSSIVVVSPVNFDSQRVAVAVEHASERIRIQTNRLSDGDVSIHDGVNIRLSCCFTHQFIELVPVTSTAKHVVGSVTYKRGFQIIVCPNALWHEQRQKSHQQHFLPMSSSNRLKFSNHNDYY